MSGRILVIDDEKNIRRTLGMVLRSEQWVVREAESGEAGLDALATETADVVLLDLNLPGIDGLETLRRIRRTAPDANVVMISGQGTVSIALEATRAGAFDFLEKPLTKERVLVAVRNAMDVGSMERDLRELRARETHRRTMIGDSAPMRALRDEIERVGPTSARVLILGESGTGKELVARAIHDSSERAEAPFVKVNCAAIPDELIESELFGATKGAYTGADASRDGRFLRADGGTIFLDEIGDMSLKAQAKVLRALQEGEIERVGGTAVVKIDVRVVAATNRDLSEAVAQGEFREDLWFRLNVVPVRTVPLRERSDDVPDLARHFLEIFRVENNRPPLTFSDEALRTITRQPWPGNVRELENSVERLAIMARSDVIGIGDLARAGIGVGDAGEVLVPGSGEAEGGMPAAGPTSEVQGVTPEAIRRIGGLVEARRRFEAACIGAALAEAKGNVSAAARSLGIDRTNLHKKIQAYGIDPAGVVSSGAKS